MNYSLIFRLLAFIMAIVAIAFGLCFCVSLVYSGNPLEAETQRDWITCFAVASIASFIFYLPGRNSSTRLFRKEAMCVVGLGWIMSSFLGALPYFLIAKVSFATAFFESASGVTSTGATIFSKVSELPHSLLFWRGLSQWIGGLGVVVFFVALLSSLGAGAKVLYSRETTVDKSSFETGKIKSGIWRILRIYIMFSVLCALAYYIAGMGSFDAICHMMTTVSTGGFSTKDTSMAFYNSLPIYWVSILFMFLGGVSFSVFLFLLKRDFKTVKKNTEFKAYALMIIVFSLTVFFTICDFSGSSFYGVFKTFTLSIFQIISIITTTGFIVADYQLWPAFTHIMLFFLFITGASSGSTSGGLKIFRALGVSKICVNDIEKSFRPNVVRTFRMNGRVIGDEAIRGMLSYVVLYSCVALVALLFLAILEQNMSFASCVFSVVSCLSNVGPGLNETGPMQNADFMSDASKTLLGMLMIIGRLELYAVLVLFMPSLWRKFK